MHKSNDSPKRPRTSRGKSPKSDGEQSGGRNNRNGQGTPETKRETPAYSPVDVEGFRAASTDDYEHQIYAEGLGSFLDDQGFVAYLADERERNWKLDPESSLYAVRVALFGRFRLEAMDADPESDCLQWIDGTVAHIDPATQSIVLLLRTCNRVSLHVPESAKGSPRKATLANGKKGGAA